MRKEWWYSMLKCSIDKYEGHTEGIWAWERGTLNVLHVKGSEPMHTLLHDEKKDVDAQLIADAPLLLAEVQQLRKQLSEAKDVIQYALDMTSDDDAKNVFEDFLGVKEE